MAAVWADALFSSWCFILDGLCLLQVCKLTKVSNRPQFSLSHSRSCETLNWMLTHRKSHQVPIIPSSWCWTEWECICKMYFDWRESAKRSKKATFEVLGQLNYVLYVTLFFPRNETKHKILCLIMACSKRTEKRTERIIKTSHLSMVLNLIFVQRKVLGFPYIPKDLGKRGKVVMKQSIQIKMRKSLMNQSPASLENHKVNLCFKSNWG